MENRDYLIILYDYYGELLNEDNKKYFEAYYFDNLSLSEIAENNDISRNAVHKHIKSSESKLLFYEDHLGMYEKSEKIKKLISDMTDTKLKEELEKIIY